MFVLCLDQPPPHSTQSPSVMERPTSSVTARQCLHGDGTQYNSANRWFDKIIQVDVNSKIASSVPVKHKDLNPKNLLTTRFECINLLILMQIYTFNLIYTFN